MNIILGRYFLYMFIGLEILFLPAFVSKELYAEIEYKKFILFFVPFLLFGANSGYIYYKYNKNQDYFYTLFLFSSLYMTILSYLIYLYTDNILFSLASFLMVMFMIIEQKVKTEKYFFLAMSIKPLISLSLLGIAILLYYYKYSIDSNIIYHAILFSFIFWIMIVVYTLKSKLVQGFHIEFKLYLKLIQKGFLINIGTLLLMLLFFTDRYFTKEYYYSDLPTYSFSYNIVQFIIIALTTLAYVNVVKIGENIENLTFKDVKRELFYAYKIFIILYLLFIVFVMILNRFYNFENLIPISLILGFFLGYFYATNSISSIAMYRDLLTKITFFMITMVLINLLLSYIFVLFKIKYIYFLIKSGLLLNLYALYLIYQIKEDTNA